MQGIIDWKGNVSKVMAGSTVSGGLAREDTDSSQFHAPSRNRNRANDYESNYLAFSDEIQATTTITVTDEDDAEWYVPLRWIEDAVERVTAGSNMDSHRMHAAVASASVELAGADGITGQLSLQTLVDVAVQTLRDEGVIL